MNDGDFIHVHCNAIYTANCAKNHWENFFASQSITQSHLSPTTTSPCIIVCKDLRIEETFRIYFSITTCSVHSSNMNNSKIAFQCTTFICENGIPKMIIIFSILLAMLVNILSFILLIILFFLSYIY